MHWERTGGAEGVPPISEELDHDLMMIRVANELNLPVTALDETPAHWVGAAMTAMEWSRLESEKASKRSRRGSKPAANPRAGQKRS